MKANKFFSVTIKKMHILIVRCAFLAVSSKGTIGYKIADTKPLPKDNKPVAMFINTESFVQKPTLIKI